MEILFPITCLNIEILFFSIFEYNLHKMYLNPLIYVIFFFLFVCPVTGENSKRSYIGCYPNPTDNIAGIQFAERIGLQTGSTDIELDIVDVCAYMCATRYYNMFTGLLFVVPIIIFIWVYFLINLLNTGS